ncbi:MAG: hypothetical protein K2W33_20425, partial [Burkholderiales bacterium]|nr:hypothetical protein [Burkholderiales bacterium]
MNPGKSGLMRTQRAVTAVLVVMLSLWLALFVYLSWDQRHDTLQDGLTTADTHSRNLEDYLTQSLRIIELSATNFETLTQLGIDWEDVNVRLVDAVRAAPFLRSLSIADANGHIVASSISADVG